MRRRRLLALVGVAGLAGCSSDRQAGTPTTADAGETPTATRPEQVTTAEPPSETKTTSEEPATTQTETEQAAEPEEDPSIRRAREHLRTAVGSFVEAAEGPDPTILDVTAATFDFSRLDVDQAVRAAKDDLGDARGRVSGEQAAIVDSLEEVADFLLTGSFAQIHLVNAHLEAKSAYRRFFREEYDELTPTAETIEERRDDAASYADSVQTSTSARSFDAFDPISVEQYELKLEQFERELTAFDVLVTQFQALEREMRALERDVSDYRFGNYDDVEFATDGFQETLTALEEIDRPDSLESIVGDLICVLDSLVAGLEVLPRAVTARKDGNTNTAESFESEAGTEFKSCELTTEVNPVRSFIEEAES